MSPTRGRWGENQSRIRLFLCRGNEPVNNLAEFYTSSDNCPSPDHFSRGPGSTHLSFAVTDFRERSLGALEVF